MLNFILFIVVGAICVGTVLAILSALFGRRTPKAKKPRVEHASSRANDEHDWP